MMSLDPAKNVRLIAPGSPGVNAGCLEHSFSSWLPFCLRQRICLATIQFWLLVVAQHGQVLWNPALASRVKAAELRSVCDTATFHCPGMSSLSSALKTGLSSGKVREEVKTAPATADLVWAVKSRGGGRKRLSQHNVPCAELTHQVTSVYGVSFRCIFTEFTERLMPLFQLNYVCQFHQLRGDSWKWSSTFYGNMEKCFAPRCWFSSLPVCCTIISLHTNLVGCVYVVFSSPDPNKPGLGFSEESVAQFPCTIFCAANKAKSNMSLETECFSSLR